jgi:uncharacterized membrane protein YdjX (TVP38/TMEM64 family)
MVTKDVANHSSRRQTVFRVILLLLVLALVGMYFLFDLGRYLDLGFLKDVHGSAVALVREHPFVATLVFFAAYVFVTALSLPGAAVMTLAGGAVFGLGWGLVIVSFASTMGATLAMLISRRLLGDMVQRKFARQLASVNGGLERDGGFYLFSIRMVPLFPFFVVNLVMGLTPIATRTFYWVSQVGMLPGTFVYVFAGTQLATVEGVGDVLSPGLIVALSLLGLFPLLARKAVGWMRDSRQRQASNETDGVARYDNNLIVIGAGSAGLIASYIAATVRAKVTLIEQGAMGGDCLNTGCVPSKTLIRSARVAHTLRTASDYGIRAVAPEVDFPTGHGAGPARRSIPSRPKIPWSATGHWASTAWPAAPA